MLELEKDIENVTYKKIYLTQREFVEKLQREIQLY